MISSFCIFLFILTMSSKIYNSPDPLSSPPPSSPSPTVIRTRKMSFESLLSPTEEPIATFSQQILHLEYFFSNGDDASSQDDAITLENDMVMMTEEEELDHEDVAFQDLDEGSKDGAGCLTDSIITGDNAADTIEEPVEEGIIVHSAATVAAAAEDMMQDNNAESVMQTNDGDQVANELTEESVKISVLFSIIQVLVLFVTDASIVLT
jgi:hypothetical protein